MRKLIMLSVLLTGCTQIAPNSLGDHELYYKDQLEWRVERTVKDALQRYNTRYQEEAESCSKISQCLGKPTYLHFNYRLDSYQCRLSGTDRHVSCMSKPND